MINSISLICDSTGRIGTMSNGVRPTEAYNDMRAPMMVNAMLSHPIHAALEPADTSRVNLRADWVYCEADSSAQAMVQFYDRTGSPVGGPVSLSAGSAVKGLNAYAVSIFGVQKTGVLVLTYGEGEPGRETGGNSFAPQGVLDIVVITGSVPGPLADTVYTTPVSTLNEQIGISIDITANQGIGFYGVTVAHWDFLRLSLAVVEDGNIKYVKPLANCRIAPAMNSLAPTLIYNPTRINTSDVLVWEYARTAAGVNAGATFPGTFVMPVFGVRPFTRYSNVHGG